MKTSGLHYAAVTFALAFSLFATGPANNKQTWELQGGACTSDDSHCMVAGYGGGHIAFFAWDMRGDKAELLVYGIDKFTVAPLSMFSVDPDPEKPGNLRIEGFGVGEDETNHQPFNLHFSLSLCPYPWHRADDTDGVLYVMNPTGNSVTIVSNLK